MTDAAANGFASAIWREVNKLQGPADAMLISPPARGLTSQSQRIAGASARAAEFGYPQRMEVAVRQEDSERPARIDAGPVIAKTIGSSDQPHEKWFGPYEDRASGWRSFVPSAAAAALVVLAGWVLWLRGRLRRDRHAAATLRASEERWKFAAEGTGDGVWDSDLVTGASAYSKRWKEMLGHTESEIGTSSDEWTQRIHPDDLARVLRDNQACIDGETDNFVSEHRMRARDGHWVWILARGKVVQRSASGKAMRMIGTHTDISRRKASEAREATRSSVMTQIASGGVLSSILHSVVRDVECRCGWTCSIMLVDASGEFLVTGAAPSLPEVFNRAVAGIGIALDQGSSGAAAYSKMRVICEDIRTDPRWMACREVAETVGLRSCWSEPILGQGGKVLGIFAAYHRQPCLPSPDDGDDLGMAAQFTAIAIEHDRAAQALHASDALLLAKSHRLEATLERMEQGLMMVNPDRVVEVCNRKAIELLGLPAELMASRPTFAQVLEFQWSQDEFAHTPADILEFVRSGGILDRPQCYERVRPNGRTIEILSVPISGGGVLRTYSDITERKRAEQALRDSEERLQRALDASRLALWDLDLNSGDIYLSEAWSEMLGGERAVTRTTFETLTAMVPDEDQALIAVAMQDALRGLTPSYSVEHRVRRPDGQVLWVLSQGRVVERGADGRVLRAVGTNRDVTGRKRAEAAQQVLESRLREAQKLEAIGTLAGGIAHDFNNILAAILGNVAFARQDIGEDHAVQSYLEQINRAGLRARSLVQQILAFSRRQPVEFVSVRLRPIVEETISMLRSTVGKTVELRAVLPDVKLSAMANPTQLQQVLLNLGTNAWHALPEGVGLIEIGLQERAFDASDSTGQRVGLAPGRYAHLWVRDNGHGMDEETRERIFEPFFTTKAVDQGTGLGLAVAHGTIDAHGGAIEVTSVVGEGSTFDLYLPLIDHQTANMPLETDPADPLHGRGQHVLYIDDDDVMALMVQGLLQRLGYRATVALDAKEAIAFVARDPAAVDLVVTDFNMPTWSGLDVARAFIRIRPDLPVAISSGFVSDELRSSAHDLGVVAVMQKERTLEELGALVHAALSPSRGQ